MDARALLINLIQKISALDAADLFLKEGEIPRFRLAKT